MSELRFASISLAKSEEKTLSVDPVIATAQATYTLLWRMTMSHTPLLVRCAKPANQSFDSSNDQVTCVDDLPAVLDRDASGYVMAGKTRMTEVQRETTDDH